MKSGWKRQRVVLQKQEWVESEVCVLHTKKSQGCVKNVGSAPSRSRAKKRGVSKIEVQEVKDMGYTFSEPSKVWMDLWQVEEWGN